MTTITIMPGAVSLREWRAIYRGATPILDESATPKIEASAASIRRIVERGEPVESVEPGIVRLMMALKLANVAQGASGVQLETVRLMEAMLANNALPVIPSQGSVGA